MLRLPVKINGVNNLSDARYCAGMGVDMVGFSTSENHPRYLPTDKINGITGWLAGIQTVAEAYDGEPQEAIVAKANLIQACAIEIDAITYKSPIELTLPLIYRLNIEDWKSLQLQLRENDLLHLIVQKTDLLKASLIKTICSSHKTLLNVTLLDLSEIEQLLPQVDAFGISLDGGNELRPGIKDFEHLAEVLEYLEA